VSWRREFLGKTLAASRQPIVFAKRTFPTVPLVKCRLRSLAALLLAVVPVVSGCTRGGSAGPTVSDSLTIAQIQEPRSLNPLFLDGYVAGEINGLLYSFLTTYDLNGGTIPQAVEIVPTVANGGISRDGLTYTFHLRHDIRWQDGVPLTARDVAFTFDAIMNPENDTLSRYGYDAVASVRTPDRYTIVVHLKYRLSPFVTYFFGGNSNYPILPAHILAKYPNVNEVPFNTQPIGSGPYRLQEWSHGDHITFVANHSYYLGNPAIKAITIQFVPDTQTIINELRTNEINAYFFADVSHMAELRTIPDHRIQTAQTTQFGTILFNTTSSLFRDVRMRQAFAFAIDRRSLTDKITHGVDNPNTPMRSLFTWAFDPTAGNIPYDPSRSDALLSSLGWHRGPDGIRVKNGKRLEVQLLYYVGSVFASSLSTMVVAYERAVGIAVSLKGLTAYALTSPTGPLYNGDFQVSVFGEESQADPDARWILGCSQRAPRGFNFMRYCSSPVDALFTRAASTQDVAYRKRAYAVVQRKLLEDLPIDFLYQVVEVDVVPSNLSGYESSMYTSPYTFVYQWKL
jgi:peptide/nickel transport system substrate-binding protein